MLLYLKSPQWMHSDVAAGAGHSRAHHAAWLWAAWPPSWTHWTAFLVHAAAPRQHSLTHTALGCTPQSAHLGSPCSPSPTLPCAVVFICVLWLMGGYINTMR